MAVFVIRSFDISDLTVVMQIWLDTNIEAHHFIPSEYWTDNYEAVRDALPQAEVLVHVDDVTGRIDGFIGLTDDYIAGIFVRSGVQSKGIGKQLLDHAKRTKSQLSLHVYQMNTRAVRFYQREQFAIHSEGTNEDTGEKEYLMVWGSESIQIEEDGL